MKRRGGYTNLPSVHLSQLERTEKLFVILNASASLSAGSAKRSEESMRSLYPP